MALPDVRLKVSTGSDTAASGAGPATAVYGAASAHTGGGASTTITLTSEPDLSGVATDGSAVLWMATASGRCWSKITGADDEADTVTVEDSFTIEAASAVDWAIGGKRATMADSLALFVDAKPGWTITLEDDQSPGVVIPCTAAGDTAIGVITLRGDSETTRRKITQTANAACLSGGLQNWIVKNLLFENTNGTKTAAYGVLFNAANAAYTRFHNCIFGDSVNTLLQATYRPASSSPSTTFSACEVRSCTTNGIGSCGGGPGGILHIRDCFIHDNTGDGINVVYSSVGINVIENNLIVDNGGNGIFVTAHAASLTSHHIIGNTIHNNGGDGIDMQGTLNWATAVVHSNQITANGGWGILGPANTDALKGMCDYNNFGTGALVNTSGAVSGVSLGAHDMAVDPGYTAAASQNYAVGTATQAKGYPDATGHIGINSSTHTFVDIGAAQREEAGGIAPEDIAAAADVRYNVDRYVGGDKGTCYVPDPAYVVAGVNVDATVGLFVDPADSDVWHGIAVGVSPRVGTMVGSDITNCIPENIKDGVLIDNVEGTLVGVEGLVSENYVHESQSVYSGGPQGLLTLPSAGFVWWDSSSYGIYGSEEQGTFHASNISGLTAAVIKEGEQIDDLYGTFTHTAAYTAKATVVAAAYVIQGHYNYASGDGGQEGTYVEAVAAGYSDMAAGYGNGGAVPGTLANAKIMDLTYGSLFAGYVLEVGGGTYHPTLTGEVVAPVTFGPNSGYIGTYPSTATTQAADAAILELQKDHLANTETVTFGVSSVVGTLNLGLYCLITGITWPELDEVDEDVFFGPLTGTEYEGTGVNATTLLTALGLATGNLDTQFTAIKGQTDKLVFGGGNDLKATLDGEEVTPTAASKTGYSLAAEQHVIVDSGTVTTLTGHTSQTGDSFARIGANGSGLTSISLSDAAEEQLVDAVFDEMIPGAHVTTNTAGKILLQARESLSIYEGTATAGTADTITINADAPAIDDFFRLHAIVLTSGTGVGQARLITAYDGETKTATLARAWKVTPNETTTFTILAGTEVHANSIDDVPASALGEAAVAVIQAGLALTGADSDTLKTLSDQIDGVEAGSGLNAQQTRDAMKLAPTAGDPADGSIDAHLDSVIAGQVTITPITATVSAGAVADSTLTAYQYMDLGPYVWTVVDGSGTAINLDGKAVYLSVFAAGAPGTILFTIAGAVSGDSSNIVTVSQDHTNTAAAGTYGYRLVNTTDDIMLNVGTLTIVEGPNVVTPA